MTTTKTTVMMLLMMMVMVVVTVMRMLMMMTMTMMHIFHRKGNMVVRHSLPAFCTMIRLGLESCAL